MRISKKPNADGCFTFSITAPTKAKMADRLNRVDDELALHGLRRVRWTSRSTYEAHGIACPCW
jgi:hypothetical protein